MQKDSGRIDTSEEEQPLTAVEATLVKMLREEADELKDCFTRYSFQALSISAIALGLITRFQRDAPYVGLSSLLVIVLVLVVARLGTYKYQGANRMYGYELHLHRVARLQHVSGSLWKDSMRRIGWEEAMRAWRVVQATAFETLYTTKRKDGWRKALRPNALRPRYVMETARWFEPATLLTPGATWYSGSYLDSMLSILHAVAIGALLPLFAMCVQMAFPQQFLGSHVFPGWVYVYGSIAVFVSASGVVVLRIRQNAARKRMIESGFLSIHSCAIMWQAVVASHHRALAQLGSGGEEGRVDKYNGYTAALSKVALDLSDHILQIHRWIDGTRGVGEESPKP